MSMEESLAPSREVGNFPVETAAARRERTILEQMPQVRLIARQFHSRLAGHVCFEDLVSSGTLGLIAAIDNFRESCGVKLRTYSDRRIRGAILDSLRGLDWVSRGGRRRAKEMAVAVRSLEQRHQRTPTAEEVAAEKSLSIDEYHARTAEAHAFRLESLDAPAGRSGNRTLGSLIPDETGNLSLAALERSECQRSLRDAIDAMPEIDRDVMVLSYYEGLTRREVAAMMGIDVSQVTRLKWLSILRLRVKMGKQLRCRAERPGSDLTSSRQHSTILLRTA
jgi:RNA polymerase sigma factor for flagellar operon FliA